MNKYKERCDYVKSRLDTLMNEYQFTKYNQENRSIQSKLIKNQSIEHLSKLLNIQSSGIVPL